MFFGKKLILHFSNLENIDVDCINNIKNIIIKERDVGFGNVCASSGGNSMIEDISNVPNIYQGFKFTLQSNSENNFNKLFSSIGDELNMLNFEFALEETIPIVEVSFENDVAVHEDVITGIVTKKRDVGYGVVSSQIYDLYERNFPHRIRDNYVCSFNIIFRCELSDVNVLLNEILGDFLENDYEVTVNFI